MFIYPRSQVNFHIVLISDNSRQLHTTNSLGAEFDVEGFKVAVEDLRLPNQVGDVKPLPGGGGGGGLPKSICIRRGVCGGWGLSWGGLFALPEGHIQCC